jgi:hypothetical protein
MSLSVGGIEKGDEKISARDRAMTKRSLLGLVFPLLWMSTASQSRPMSVGGTMLEIPEPPGFALVTPQMATVLQARQSFRDPNAGHFFFYIQESEIPMALKGKLPSSGRSCTAEPDESLFVSQAEFAEAKRGIRVESEEFYREFAKELPGLMGNANDRVTKQLNVDYALSVSDLVPLSPHEETNRTLAWSTFSKVGARDTVGSPVSLVMVNTTTLIYVRGKVLYLTCCAEENGLAWSRATSKKWTDLVLAANPVDPQSSATESTPPTRGSDGVAIGKVLGVIIIGGVIVLRGCIGHRCKAGNEGEQAQSPSR